MDKKSEFIYFMVLTAIMIMVSLHNLIKSILLYRASNKSTISSGIKIIYNISGLVCSVFNIEVLLTINTASLSKCLTVTYLQMIMNFAFSESIIIFLVWKLRQFKRSNKVGYVIYGLFLIRSLSHIIYIVFIKPQITFDTVSPDITLCDNDTNHGRIFLLIATITDLLIDAYVAFCFIQYIRRNLNATQNDKHIHLPYNLFVWNSLLISIASLNYINIIIYKDPIIDYTIKTIIFILLSYLITFNKEILKDDSLNENLLENGNYKEKNVSNNNIIKESSTSDGNDDDNDDDLVLRASNGMLVDMPLKNVRDEIKMVQKYKTEKLDPNGDVGILKQSLSFYEVASMFLGKDNKRQSC